MRKGSIILPLILVLFIMASVPAVFTITINNHNLRINSENAISKSVMDKLQASQELCDERLSQYIYEALDFILERQYVKLNSIHSYQELNSDYENVILALGMNDELKNFVERHSMLHSIFFYIDQSDYVVATNGGIVRLEEFEDQDWLKEIAQKKKSASGIWYPRKTFSDNEGETELLSYVYSSNSLYTSSKVTVVINVYEAAVADLIFSEEDIIEGTGYLVNGNGDVIAHSDKAFLHSNIYQEIHTILNVEDRGSVIRGNDEILVYQKSELYDWIYVNVYSEKEIFRESAQILQWGIVMTLLVILGGVVLAVFLAFRITKPVRRLVNKMKSMNPEEEAADESGNELAFLSNALEQMKEREKQLESSLEARTDSARRRAVYDLMQGEDLAAESRKLLDAHFPYSHFMVCMILLDDTAEYLKQTSHEERKIYRNMLFEQMKQVFPKGYHYECVRYDVTSIAILVNFKNYDSARVTSEIHRSMDILKEKYQSASGWGTTIGVSLVHDHYEEIHKCAEEAGRAAGRRLTLGKGRIIFAQEYKNTNIQTYEFYQNEKRIMNYLELGNLDKIREELNLMMCDIRNLDNILEDNVMLVFNQMLGDILVYLNKHNYSVNLVLQEKQGNLYSALTELETMEEICGYLEAIYGQIIAYQIKEANGDEDEDGDYVRLILKYIRQHYREDIDFAMMAEEIGISYSYARKIIKAAVGRSLIEYLNLIRVDEAKKLLEQGEIPMSEIAELVGYHNVQSLYRFFKKFEGVTPNVYRERIIKRILT